VRKGGDSVRQSGIMPTVPRFAARIEEGVASLLPESTSLHPSSIAVSEKRPIPPPLASAFEESGRGLMVALRGSLATRVSPSALRGWPHSLNLRMSSRAATQSLRMATRFVCTTVLWARALPSRAAVSGPCWSGLSGTLPSTREIFNEFPLDVEDMSTRYGSGRTLEGVPRGRASTRRTDGATVEWEWLMPREELR
jgi:hypothetical protein